MEATEKLGTHQKALTLNLDTSKYGSFAEIGAGQEVARWFLVVGAASGTVAKTISAYDKEVSDDLYGRGSRYVSRERLEAMLESEWKQLLNQLGSTRGSRTCFFSFVDTVSARNFAGTNDPHGWVALRFQLQPNSPPNDVVLHINMRDASNLLEQEAIGILGVNLVYAAFHQLQTKESFCAGLVEDLENRIEVDFVALRGPAFEVWDQRTLLAHLVSAGFADAVAFPAAGPLVPPTEVLYKKSVVLAPGYFEHADPAHTKIHLRMMASAIQQLREEPVESKSEPKGFFCLPAIPVRAQDKAPEIPELLHRIDALHSQGGDVLLFGERELYAMADFVNRYTKEPVRFVAGLSLVIRAYEDRYSKLEGSLLTALAHLFSRNVRMYAYPMMAGDLTESIADLGATGWSWDETNGWVSAAQLRPPAPQSYLYEYALASKFLVPLKVPAAQSAEA